MTSSRRRNGEIPHFTNKLFLSWIASDPKSTTLSLQMRTRQSEDLYFMKWRTSKQKKMEVAWYQIEKELTVIDDISTEPLLTVA